MKEANHNSMDLLLRSLARGQEESRLGGESGSAVSKHLDADELNLYAEGVLTPPARASYTEHLADCQSCRKLVAALAQAAGRTVRQETTSQQSGAGFWRSLAMLFSLPVVRYALPAILLTGVLAIGLLALREQRSPDLVAVNQQVEPKPVFDQQTEATRNAATSASSPSVSQRQVAQGNSSSNAVANESPGSTGLFTEKPGSTTESKIADSSAAKNTPESPHVEGFVTSQPSYAPEPPPPPKVGSEAQAKPEARKEDAYARAAAKRNQDEVSRVSKDESPTHGPARSRTTATGGRRDADVAAENRAADGHDKKDAAEETETRTVSGRRFRRQGNAWVDSAYQSSHGVTTVGRGSEHFRALMADEPGLLAIVQRLGGEVVVVWKNRAYRFR